MTMRRRSKTLFQYSVWCVLVAFLFGTATTFGIASAGLVAGLPLTSLYLAFYASPFCLIAALPVAVAHIWTTRPVALHTGAWRGALASGISTFLMLFWLSNNGSVINFAQSLVILCALLVAATFGSIFGALLARTEQSDA
jgi:hypothetical protein